MKSKEEKQGLRESAREARKAATLNRLLTRKLEKRRQRKRLDPAHAQVQMRDEGNVLEIDGLCTYFFTDEGVVKAVDGVSFNIPKNSTLCVVGESGCGKSVTSLSVMQLLPRPVGQVVGGEIRFLQKDGTGVDIARLTDSEMSQIRGNGISMIFQEPMTSLNPVFRIGEQVGEVIRLCNPTLSSAAVRERTVGALRAVGIANAEGVYKAYPHELSGGMRQRVMIAMALSSSPRLIIADEPTTALDVTIQAQILELLSRMKREIESSVMLITHDLGVVAQMADYVVVMYAGRVVEKGSVEELFKNPKHPYTLGLMKSKPSVDKPTDVLYNIRGGLPHPVGLPDKCYFKDRCDMCIPECDGGYPPTVDLGGGHSVSCYRCVSEGRASEYGKTKNAEDIYNELKQSGEA